MKHHEDFKYYADFSYYEVEEQNTIALDFNENNDLRYIKYFLEQNTDKTFIVYQTGDLPPFFEDYDYINLAQDVADNFSLELYKKSKDIETTLSAFMWLYYERIKYINAKYVLGYPKLTNAQAVSKYLDLKKSNREVDLPLDVDEGDEVVKYFLNGSFLKKNYPIKLCNLEVCFSGGGIHGSINHYFKNYSYLESPMYLNSNPPFTKDTTSTKAYYFDIMSFYPSILYHYNLIDNEKFRKLYVDHLIKPTSATKLVLNTISGLLELYEPQVAVTMRATGQLLIYEMLKQLDGTINLLNANTDGIIFETNDIEKVRAIVKNCEISNVSTIKEQEIERIAIKDINNLFIRFCDDTYKIVGYLNYGVNNKGKFSINNNEIYVKYSVLKTLYPNSVADCDIDEKAFRYYVPLGSYENFKYRGKIYNDKVLVCYASKEQGGALYKKSGDKYIKVPNIPDNVTLDENEIDYTYYEDKVKEVLKDYGYNQNEDISNNLRKEANMPEKENLNVYQRLLRARSDFLKSGAKKTGHNSFSHFYYFTLDDLVPVITSIFTKYELIALTDFTSDIGTMTIYSADDPMDCVVFHSPMPTDESLGNAITNGMQRIGAVETYQRRYLYLMALDIIEPEIIDEQDNTVREPKKVVEKVNTPVSPQKVVSKTDGNIVTEQDRTNAKEQVLKQDLADATTIENLQKAIDVAVEKKPDVANVINRLYAQTNHLQTITTERARSVIDWLEKELAR